MPNLRACVENDVHILSYVVDEVKGVIEVVFLWRLWCGNEGSCYERDAERDEDALCDQDSVVAPAEDGKG